MYDKIKTPIEKTEQSSLHFLECSITCQLIKQNHIVKKECPQKNKNKIVNKVKFIPENYLQTAN